VAEDVAVQGDLDSLVGFGLETRCQKLVRVVGAEEVSLADEETLFVVVGVYKLATGFLLKRRKTTEPLNSTEYSPVAGF
jgi:hypothetical protein